MWSTVEHLSRGLHVAVSLFICILTPSCRARCMRGRDRVQARAEGAVNEASIGVCALRGG